MTSTTNWWAHHTKTTRTEAHRLDDGHEPVRRALAHGTVLGDQAAMIVEAIEALPADLPNADVVIETETVLLAYATDHDAKARRVLSRRVLALSTWVAFTSASASANANANAASAHRSRSKAMVPWWCVNRSPSGWRLPRPRGDRSKLGVTDTAFACVRTTAFAVWSSTAKRWSFNSSTHRS